MGKQQKPRQPQGKSKINLSELGPDEILSGLLATPPPAEKQAKKAQRKATRTPRTPHKRSAAKEKPEGER